MRQNFNMRIYVFCLLLFIPYFSSYFGFISFNFKIIFSGERCNVKRVDGGSIFDPTKHGEKFGLDWFEEDLYVITLKS